MSDIPGLPTQGSNVTVLITKVDSNTLCALIEFWGNFGLAQARDYQSLVKNIQSPVNLFQEFEGNSGDLCLVQIDGTWYRSRIVTRNGSNCQVLLIDKGITCSTTTKLLAWGKREHFHLPPQVELCVLANVWPHSLENRWSPFALEFLQTFRGKMVKAHVQDALVNQRKLLLDIPCITRQMFEMGFAKKVEPNMFLDFVLSPESKIKAEHFHQTSMGEVEQLHQKDLYTVPKLSTGAVETVVVTEVTNPQRIFCQLKVFTQELKELSEEIRRRCRGRTVSCSVKPEMIGFPCAARGNDGNWYRSVLQQVFPVSQLVEVLNVDYGVKRLVQMENVRPLAPEFFKMPVVTYVCSLHGLFDKGVGWTSTQINYLKSLLLYNTFIAKFHYHSISEGVYYVTLYGDENTDLNQVYFSKILLENEETLCDYATENTAKGTHDPPRFPINEGIMSPTMVAEAKVERNNAFLADNVSHVACVSHVSNPAEFRIPRQKRASELDELVGPVFHLYKFSDSKHLMETPAVDACCASKAADGDFNRAIVSEVGGTKIKVFLVDYGGTKEVDESHIRTLLCGLQKAPQLAVKCSLADLGPKDLSWSRSAVEFFIKMITDKLLNVHVMENRNDTSAITLVDPQSQGESHIGKMLCSSGHGNCSEMEKKSRSQNSEALGVHGKSKGSSRTQNSVDLSSKALQIGTFRENMFPVGSILDVTVSYIESPNNFWCQLAPSSEKLKMLMHAIQAHYAGSVYEPLTEAACVVRHPDNGLWYRGLVIRKHESTRVAVLFIDYGHTKTVSLHDLRKISREFLELHGQAFRCSLYNPLKVISVANEWNEKGKDAFLHFVKTAASNRITLKCTVYAVTYNEEKLVLNIVDLETPFESICTSMAKLTPGKAVPEPSYRLDTYNYSTHSIKIGTEEQVTVTCVNSVGHFYCQLERNADVLKDLNKKVNHLCHQLGHVNPPTLFQKLCFAKYTDGLWYRAQIKVTRPSILVYFVDYGDTAEVAHSDVLPVPKEANDIMSVPMQAVLCRLSDVPIDVPAEVNNWFQTSATECKFRAIVVAKEPSGSLLVELYDKNTQINSKLNKKFQLQVPTERQVISQHRKALEDANGEKEAMFVSAQVRQKNTGHYIKPAHQATRPPRWNLRNEQKGKTSSQELYHPPHQRHHPSNQSSRTERKEKLDPESPVQEFGIVLPQAKYPKVAKLQDLPKNVITADMEADVYVSHYNSPSSFYVQLVREEDEIFSLVDKLNEPLSTPKRTITRVDPGDLVEAEFPDDSLWYRAGVTEVLSGSLALVEFVDFGNTARLPFSKLAQLNQAFAQLPRYSTHCMLSEAGSLAALDSEVASTLKREIGSNAEKMLKCRFVRRSGIMWQVTLEDNGVQVTCKACPETPPAMEHQTGECARGSETSLNFYSLCYRHLEFAEGQQLDVYISAFRDAHTFWCQPANSVALDRITESLSQIGNAAYNTSVGVSALSPGTPCIAFFAEDQVWCRAEVLSKDGDELSVLFVDYGNAAKVTGADVMEIPPELLQTHLQAFLCQLDGFDESRGSWRDGAFDELASIAENKLLQMTVTKPSREDGTSVYLVQLECEGQRLNETMKRWWMTSMLENKPHLAQHVQDEKLGPSDASVKKTENEALEGENTRLAHNGTDHHDADLHCAVTSTPKDIRGPHTSVLSTERPPEENCLSESRSLNETSQWGMTIPHLEPISQIDSGIEHNVASLQNMSKSAVGSGQDFDEEAASAIDAPLSDEMDSPPTKNIREATVESLSPFEMVDRHNTSDRSNARTNSDEPNGFPDDGNVANSNPVTNWTSVKVGAVAEEVIHSVKSLTDPNEQSDVAMAARNQCHISVSGEEMVLTKLLHPFEPPVWQVIESSSSSSEESLPIPEEKERSTQDESNPMAE
ncbi:tudor domain-containing 6 [Hippocampus zosterae]|uniref:tudor domain-containing 6 n=1 Tax=Hippocampus zosterae TaxID=109293 RepID=UPI00223D1D60|nr:tudor domain-containing 6 [Hippocampus zosterae]